MQEADVDQGCVGADSGIILGIEAFRTCVEQARKVGIWRAWRDGYFERFRGAFQPMLDVIYHCDVDDLRPYVEALDLEAALASADRFVADGGVDCVCRTLARCQDLLPIPEEIPVYLIIGLGHANGMALPASSPYMFIGLERYSNLDSLAGLIAHEVNHLFRVVTKYRDVDPATLTIGDFTVSEGLATVFNLVFTGQAATPEAIAACIPALGEPAAAVAREPEMRAEIIEHWDRIADSGTLERFVMSGTCYLVGGMMIAGLLDAGHDICELSRTPTERLEHLLGCRQDV